MDILLMVEGVASSFGSSATSSLSLEHDEIETSSVVSDVVSISIFGSEMQDSEIIELRQVQRVQLEFQLPQPYCGSTQIS